MARILRAERRGPRVVAAPVLDAHAEAAQLRSHAQHAAERLREEARARGRAEAAAELAAERLRMAAADAERARAMEHEALQVALMAARRIVGEAIALEPERSARIVGDLLARVRRATRVSVRVHPDDVATLSAARAQLQGALEAPEASIEIVADPDVSRGGCVVHSDVGSLDARLEVQLEALSRALEG